ncbi:MAG: hypothetical protein NTZ48_06255 [Candidatus Omnitrophica bacterium]|nr:hypothetical protein [Candidatus Omnitrophota bacterium]
MKTQCEKCEEIKLLAESLKAEVKANGPCIKRAIKNSDYAHAAHLASVNGALEYVIDKIDGILTLK